MPNALVETEITSLNQFTEVVEALLGSHGGPFWYRGTWDSAYNLIPGLYRHPTITAEDDLLKLEASVIARFKQRSIPYLTRSFSDNWEYLYFMQHFGVPTRLLDWTENPYLALYFALSKPASGYAGAVPLHSVDSAVWILSCSEWNKWALRHIGHSGQVLAVPDPPLKGYEPGADPMNVNPVAMYGVYNSPRIVAQRGVFTIFGRHTTPMEALYMTQDMHAGTLQKLVVRSANVQALFDSLQAIGYSDSVVYPDLDGLAKETKRFFKFKL